MAMALTYNRDDGSIITLEEVEERSLKYIRNIVLGLNQNLSLPMLKNWLKNDMRLMKCPPDAVLMRWLARWDAKYLAQWSFENDTKPESN